MHHIVLLSIELFDNKRLLRNDTIAEPKQSNTYLKTRQGNIQTRPRKKPKSLDHHQILYLYCLELLEFPWVRLTESPIESYQLGNAGIRRKVLEFAWSIDGKDSSSDIQQCNPEFQ